MRYVVLLASLAWVGASAFGNTVDAPPIFSKAVGQVMATVVTPVPATLVPGTLTDCRVVGPQLDGTIIHTCELRGGSLTIGGRQRVAIGRVQVIQARKALETGKAYVVYSFLGTASVPADEPFLAIVTRHEGSTRLRGDVQFRQLGGKTPIVLDVVAR
jgi:hypothetical protein